MYKMSLLTKYDYNYLLVYVDGDNELKELYREKIDEHNNKIKNNSFPDAGFDLFCPEKKDIHYNRRNMIDLQIKCAMYKNVNCDGGPVKRYLSYYMYPRSSISKTSIRLANSVGIIDSGYRGSLIGAFRCLPYFKNDIASNYTVIANTRLLQICHPTLCPIYVTIVNANDLSSSVRGDGGFGSTK